MNEKIDLKHLKETIDGCIQQLNNDLQITKLDEKTMILAAEYNNSKATTWGLYMEQGRVTSYDIGYRLIRDEIERRLDLADDDKKLLLDGVMGWVYYTQSKEIDDEKNQAVLKYKDQHGMEKLRNDIIKVSEIFIELQSQAMTLKDQRAAVETYIQSCRRIGTHRFWELNELIPELELEPELDAIAYRKVMEKK